MMNIEQWRVDIVAILLAQCYFALDKCAQSLQSVFEHSTCTRAERRIRIVMGTRWRRIIGRNTVA